MKHLFGAINRLDPEGLVAKPKARLATVPYERGNVFRAFVEEEHGLAVVRRLDLEGIIARRKADT